jgi:hypothetical protein
MSKLKRPPHIINKNRGGQAATVARFATIYHLAKYTRVDGCYEIISVACIEAIISVEYIGRSDPIRGNSSVG